MNVILIRQSRRCDNPQDLPGCIGKPDAGWQSQGQADGFHHRLKELLSVKLLRGGHGSLSLPSLCTAIQL